MTKERRFDLIIVGGGHNGLVTAAYCARAGLSVLVLERRAVVGGAAVTEEFHPGFRNSTCSYTVSLLNPKVVRELDLHRHGLRIVLRPLSNFLPLPDGRALELSSDVARNCTSFAQFSQRDAEALARYHAVIERLADTLRVLVLETPPNIGGGLGDWLRAWRASRPFRALDLEGQRDLLDVMTLSAAEFLARFFESDEVKALLAFDSVVGSFVSPYHPGTAYVLLHHCFGEVNGRRGAWGHAIGGMGAISEAIAAAARKAGATILTDASVAKILVETGRVTGAVTEDGRRFLSSTIAANVDPRRLYLHLIDSTALAPELRARFKAYRCGSASFRVNVALAELPDFLARPGSGDHHGAGIYIAPSLDYMDRAWRDAKDHGWSREPVIEMMIPSTLDDSLAPAGRHVASLFCQHFAPELPDGRRWDDQREAAADTVIDTVTRYAPNFRDAVVGRRILSPLDLEREFGLTGGDIFHGALSLNQLFSARPILGLGNYRGAMTGLYHCGSGAHPGGGVTGLPGHNAAREILRDRRRLPRRHH